MLYYRPDKYIIDEKTGCSTIPYELLTRQERYKRFPSVPDSAFDFALISKKQTMKYCGKRVPFTGVKVYIIKSF